MSRFEWTDRQLAFCSFFKFLVKKQYHQTGYQWNVSTRFTRTYSMYIHVWRKVQQMVTRAHQYKMFWTREQYSIVHHSGVVVAPKKACHHLWSHKEKSVRVFIMECIPQLVSVCVYVFLDWSFELKSLILESLCKETNTLRNSAILPLYFTTNYLAKPIGERVGVRPDLLWLECARLQPCRT